MDIADAVTTEYVSFEPSTRVAKLRGAFDDDMRTNVIVIEDDDGMEGVVSRKELLASHHAPDQKAGSIVRSPPRVSRTEDVRETARLMVENELKLLPVFEGDEFVGVVTDRSLLALVTESLDALDVSDVFTRDLVYVEPDTTIGEVIHTLRTHDISRVPVVDDEEAVGLVSVQDLVDFTVRKMDREQGGRPDGFDGHGGDGSREGFRATGGRGERRGESSRMLDLPARDVMSTPVRTVDHDASLEAAVEEILANDYSSLVVSSEDVRWPLGIVTTTDVLRALTVTEEEHLPVQVLGVDHLLDLTKADIAERIEEIDGKYERMDILEANVIFHEHRERQRGTPLIRATVRLFTDEGQFAGTGEEYGDRAAFDDAAAVAEENALEDKQRKHPGGKRNAGQVDPEKLLGWWLEA